MKKNLKIYICLFILLSLMIIVFLGVKPSAERIIFEVTKLSRSDKKKIDKKDFYRIDCPVAPDRLKKVVVSYYDFDGKIHNDGEIIVLDTVAESVKTIFEEAFALQFPINSIIPPYYFKKDYYDDKLNNTSSFKCRQISNGKNLSIHSYGLAIDFNPKENPFLYPVKDEEKLSLFDRKSDGAAYAVWPESGAMYLNRTKKKPGMVEPIVDIVKRNGFTIWGGDWDFPLDWMHFQTSRELAEKLSAADSETAKKIWEQHLNDINNPIENAVKTENP